MSVYVDDMRAPFGNMVMCHMWADTREELFAMADRIGVFDIAQSKRALAVKSGAIQTDRYGPVEHCARLAGNTRKLEMIAELRKARRCETNMVGDAGECLACDAEQGEHCRG